MKNIIIVSGYSSHVGGVETVTFSLIEILNKNGYNVTFITAEDYLKENKLSLVDKILFKLIGMPYISMKSYKKLQFKDCITICNGEFSFGISSENSITLFHGSAYGYRKCLSKKLKLKNRLSLYRASILQRIGSRNKTNVAVSDFAKEYLNNVGINVHKVIYNGVEQGLFRDSNIKRKDFLAIGSSAYDGYAKGFDIINVLTNKIKIKCISNAEPFKGADWENFVAYNQLPQIYSGYKILIFPSRFEACQMVPIEAMLCGLPVIISDVGISYLLKEVIPEFVCLSNEPSEYIKHISIILSDYEKFQKKGLLFANKYFGAKVFEKNWLHFLKDFINEI